MSQKTGDIFIGAGGDLSKRSISQAQIRPIISYQFTNNIQAGTSFVRFQSSSSLYNYYSIFVRYIYDSKSSYRPFIHGELSTSFSDPFFGVKLGGGVITEICRGIYIDPMVYFRYIENVNLHSVAELSVNLIIKL